MRVAPVVVRWPRHARPRRARAKIAIPGSVGRTPESMKPDLTGAARAEPERTAELRKASLEVRASEPRLRAITDSAQDAILMMDPEGRVSYWNPAAERILGYTSAEAIGHVKSLSGLLPICAGCKNIRDDTGYWSAVESYIQKHSEAKFTHGLCPDCIKKYYPDLEQPVRSS